MRNVVDFSVLKEDKKYAILAVLGWRWRQLLKKRSIAHNSLFRGAYDFNKPVYFAALMERWCATDKPQLIYCHPGIPDAGLAKFDTVLEPRRKEYDFLNGAMFRSWLENQKVQLVKRP